MDREASICNRELAAAPTPPPPPSRGQIIAQVEECAQLSVSGWQAGLERHAGVGEGTDGCEALPRPWERRSRSNHTHAGGVGAVFCVARTARSVSHVSERQRYVIEYFACSYSLFIHTRTHVFPTTTQTFVRSGVLHSQLAAIPTTPRHLPPLTQRLLYPQPPALSSGAS